MTKDASFFSRVRAKASAYQAERARKKAAAVALRAKQEAEEKARREKIASGEVEPINVSINLEPNESAYFIISARRMAIIDRLEEETKGKTRKKGVVGRAVVGGLLLGPLGAAAGAVTAKSDSNAKTTQRIVSTTEEVDNGELILTNKRVIFHGQNVLSLRYTDILSSSVSRYNEVIFKYADMMKGEHYIISGSHADDIALYYEGIEKLNNKKR